jgi:hypothetical protein
MKNSVINRAQAIFAAPIGPSQNWVLLMKEASHVHYRQENLSAQTLLPRAVREAKTSLYECPEDIYKSLILLGNEY